MRRCIDIELYIGKKAKNKVRIINDIAIVETTRGEFTIDRGDIELIKNNTWWINNHGYVYSRNYKNNSKTTIYLSRYLMNPPKGIEIDHIDMNKRNNRRSNLRLADRVTNNANKGKSRRGKGSYKGIKQVSNGDWSSHLILNQKSISIGTYVSEIAAANAYNFYVKQYLGEYARLNETPLMEDWYNYRVKRGLKTKYIGVTKRPGGTPKPWQAFINREGRRYCIGHFHNDKDAAKFYNVEAIKLMYDLPKLNIIDGSIYGITDEILNKHYKYIMELPK